MDLLAAQDPGVQPVARFGGDPKAGALALRVAGALHRIAQDGRDDRLAELYSHAEASQARDSAPLLSSTLRANGDRLEIYLAHAPQTNEVARSAMLLGGFLTVAQAWRLPLAVLEIGASAGLNLLFDRYRYDFREWTWGPQDARLTIAADWEGSRPPDANPIIAARLGCDRRPLDLRDDEARRRLRSYVWADQKDRMERLDRAIATALADPPRIEHADAADWLEALLAQPRPERVTVILHSIVWQYLGAEAQGAHHRSDHAVRRTGQCRGTACLAAPGAGIGCRTTGTPADLMAGRRGTSPRARGLSRPAHDLARPAARLIEATGRIATTGDAHVRAGCVL